jgi:hypothetical protein
MGLFNWLTRKPNEDDAARDSSVLEITEPTALAARPAGGAINPSLPSNVGGVVQAAAQSAAVRGEARRNERNAHRELLHQIVRESMVRVGMLSASYKFKVLSLDPRGQHFLVMMDLPREFAEQVEGLREIERLITGSAKTRHGMIVNAVYWRVLPVNATASGPVPMPSAPVPLQQPSAPMAMPQAVAAPARPSASKGEPVLDDEIVALRKALASGGAPAKPVAQATAKPAATAAKPAGKDKRGNNPLLNTGFEETEMIDPDEPFPVLGATQYGTLN